MLGGLTPNEGGVSITANGQYISYSTGAINAAIGGTLAGKMITIELGGAVGSTPHSPATYYIADFGSEKWYIVQN